MPILNQSKEKQEKYWKDRAKRLILAAEKSVAELNVGQIDVYKSTQKAIRKEIEAFWGRYAKEQGLTIEYVMQRLNPAELKSYREQTKEHYDAIKETDYAFDPAYRERLHRELSAKSYMSRLEELQANIQFEIEKLYAIQQTEFNEGLSETYEGSYYRTIFDIQQGTGIGGSFTKLNTKVIEKAVATKWLGDNYSDRIWTNKDRLTNTLSRVIPQGIALGQNPKVIAKEVQSAMDTSYSNAVRLARTEFNHIANEASFKGYEESGVVEQYQYLSTLDTRTSDFCIPMDLKIFKLSEKIVGVNYPPLHPNCRSTTIPYFALDEIDAMFEKSTRIARNPETSKNYYVPADMTYSEWKKLNGIKLLKG